MGHRALRYLCHDRDRRGSAFECPAHEGLHIRETTCIAEAVDYNGEPVADGEPANGLLVTSWLNRTLPLIRYHLEDEMTLTSEPCRCGLESKRIVKLSGRAEDTIRLAAPTAERSRSSEQLRGDDRGAPGDRPLPSATTSRLHHHLSRRARPSRDRLDHTARL